jgi:hypothetical protein
MESEDHVTIISHGALQSVVGDKARAGGQGQRDARRRLQQNRGSSSATASVFATRLAFKAEILHAVAKRERCVRFDGILNPGGTGSAALDKAVDRLRARGAAGSLTPITGYAPTLLMRHSHPRGIKVKIFGEARVDEGDAALIRWLRIPSVSGRAGIGCIVIPPRQNQPPRSHTARSTSATNRPFKADRRFCRRHARCRGLSDVITARKAPSVIENLAIKIEQ